MGAFYFECTDCKKRVMKLLDQLFKTDKFYCPTCKKLLQRCDTSAASFQVKETLDNGLMTKAVERFTDAEQVFDDNSKVGRS